MLGVVGRRLQEIVIILDTRINHELVDFKGYDGMTQEDERVGERKREELGRTEEFARQKKREHSSAM